jgi:predicted ATPase/transcriptional regulator with XRE-family HTH domain
MSTHPNHGRHFYVKEKKLLPSELVLMYRHRAGLTQPQFASLAGLNSKRIVQYWETGASLPKPETLKKLVESLLTNGILLSNQEWDEVVQFWGSVKDAFDTRLGNLSPYPVLDERWLEALILVSKKHPSDQVHIQVNKSTLANLPDKNSPLPSLINLHVLSSKAPLHNLPEQVSSFIGREKEAGIIEKLIIKDKIRLITLVGTGGCGKTRLSLHIAGRLLDRFTDGVWFVELAALSDPMHITQTIASTFGISEQAGRPILTTLGDYLRSRNILLVIDNCEHLIAECARVMEKLLNISSNLQILATSREDLGIIGETTFRVPSLTLPDPFTMPEVVALPTYEAVGLFIERAAATNSNFSLTNQNAAAVVKLCSQLDGIPLAIELAAARIKVLTVEQIAARLDARFDLFTGGSRTALPRQQTLRALVDWSFDLLSDSEKGLFTRLSVFAGGWTLAAAVAVCGGGGSKINDGSNSSSSDKYLEEFEILNALSGLVHKSLVQVDESKDNIEVRYHFLETIRQYGLEKLKAAGEEREILERHLVYFTSLTQDYRHKLLSREMKVTLMRLEKELENIRIALKFGMDQEHCDLELQLVLNLAIYWEVRGFYTEGRRNIEQVLALPFTPDSEINRGFVLFFAGLFAIRNLDASALRTYSDECLAVSLKHTDERLTAFAYSAMGNIARAEGNFAEARWCFEKSLVHTQEQAGFYRGIGLHDLGSVLTDKGDYKEADRVLKEAEIISRELGQPMLTSWILLDMAKLNLILKKDYYKTHHYLAEALFLSEETNNRYGIQIVLTQSSITYIEEGKFEEAKQFLRASLNLTLRWGESMDLWSSFVGVLGVLIKFWLKSRQENIPEEIACLYGVVYTLIAGWIQPLPLPYRVFYEQAQVVARSGLDEATYGKAFARGKAMSEAEAIAYALQTLDGV